VEVLCNIATMSIATSVNLAGPSCAGGKIDQTNALIIGRKCPVTVSTDVGALV
jgi:hypothetical protein